MMQDRDKWNEFTVLEFKPKTFQPQDVELAITHCGVCGSDVHTLTQGWGESKLPLVVGHEIVGTVIRVGNKVTEFKPGDRVGVGAQIGSCLSCRACKDGYENYCPNGIDTYVSYPSFWYLSVDAMAIYACRMLNIRTVWLHKAAIPLPFVLTSASCSPSPRRSSPVTLPP